MYERLFGPLVSWYNVQSPRDQRVLMALCIMVPIILLTALMLGLHGSNKAILAQYDDEHNHMVLMTSHASQLVQAQTSHRPLIEIIEQSAVQAGLKLETTAEGGGIQARTSHTNFAVMANWLSAISQQGVTVSKMNMQQEPNGMIAVEVELGP